MSDKGKAHLALCVVTLIYGLFYVALKIMVSEIPPWNVFFVRLLLATPLLFVLEKIFYNTRFESKRDLLKIAGVGLLGVTIVQSSIVIGVSYTSLFHTGFIVGTAPLSALIISVLLKQEALAWRKVIGILIAFGGLGLLLTARHQGEALPPTFLFGDAIVFVNIVCWSLFLILSRPLLQKYPPFSVSSYAFILSGIITLPFFAFTFKQLPWVGLSPAGWGWMGFVVIFCTVISYFLNYYSLSKVSATMVSVYVLLQPFMVTLFGAWVLGESITWTMIAEGLLILAGVAIAITGREEIKRPAIRAEPVSPQPVTE